MTVFAKNRWLLALIGLIYGSLVSGEEAIGIFISQPTAGEPQFGELELVVDVYPANQVARVELMVDGKTVADLDQPPFRAWVDVGEKNLEHRFEARAYDANGEMAEALVVSPAFSVNEAVDASLQQLYITVTRGSSRVLNLHQEDFAIVDKGALQQTITFARGDVRLTAAILVDASASMVGSRLRHALRGATSFIKGMKESDSAALFLFSDRLLHVTPFSNDPEQLFAGLAGVSADGGTALNDHFYLALKRLETRQGRRVVILLSDGIDSHSALRMREARWLARRSRALVYWIRTDPGDERRQSRFSSWKNPRRYRAEYDMLIDTVLETGGRIVTLASIDQAEAAFREILAELREQYVLGYYPDNALNDGSWHKVTVRLRAAGLRVRTRGGYLDY